MYYELFIDVFFLTNLVMDYFLLRTVNRLLGCTATRLRSLAGGVFGALALSLIVIIWLPERQILNTILVHVVINTIMVKFGCKIKGWNKLLQGVLALYLISSLFGGFFVLFRQKEPVPDFPTFLFLAVASYLVITAAIQGYNRLKKKEKNCYEVVLYAGGKCREVRGFYDTGNRLKDPFSGKPVSIVKEGELLSLLKDGDRSHMTPHYIPFCSLGCKSGVIMTVTLDLLTIRNEKESKTVKRPVVAIEKGNGSFAGDCQMILNPDLVDS